MRYFITCLSGLVFGFGLTLSGMLNPYKVHSFLDISRNWDPSLAFVMIGGILITVFGYRVTFKRSKPIFEEKFYLPIYKKVDLKLIGGSTFFGIGWGIGGLCPGPSIAILSSNFFPSIIFTISMLFGLFLGKKLIN